MAVVDVVWHPLSNFIVIIFIVNRPLEVAAAAAAAGVAADVERRRLLDRPRPAAESSNNHAAHAQHEGQEGEPGGPGPGAVRQQEPRHDQHRPHLDGFVQPVQSGKMEDFPVKTARGMRIAFAVLTGPIFETR